MNPEIYTLIEISLIKSLMILFREIITDDEELYGFTLFEFDDVLNVDLIDESKNSIDHSWIVLHNMFSLLLCDYPQLILAQVEAKTVLLFMEKLKEA